MAFLRLGLGGLRLSQSFQKNLRGKVLVLSGRVRYCLVKHGSETLGDAKSGLGLGSNRSPAIQKDLTDCLEWRYSQVREKSECP